MASSELKYCPRCNSTFECRVDNISLCQCSKIIIDDKLKSYLEENYTDCLCASCMEEIKSILNNTLSSEEEM